MNPRLSIIIPVYREADAISAAIHALLDLKIPIPFEIIVSDGEDCRSTLTHLTADKTLFPRHPVRQIASPKGRGPQLNAGAKAAAGELFFFLHVDTRIDQKGMDLMVIAWQAQANPLFCGAFDLHIDSKKNIFRMIEKIASARSRLTKIPYGDQGIFMSRQLFERINGFPDIPIMEDVGIMAKIKRLSIAPVFLPHTIATSARRWEDQGILFTSFRNWILLFLYALGIPPRVLAKFY
ncbi:MAG: TIGR04283 family arsenosugar biosynthesis glycosyltransferase [Proteobacteria bacterium]|nr:glycosyltransferase [Desulfobacula sp.]MBU3954089.1 TIGR04283 family arsenosugar biosynthesis glycosyltransferase [Pseudomonadota bacterium]